MREEADVNKVVLCLPLETLGIMTGIVLCILQGVGVINIGWFWCIFPFWILIASYLALLVIVILIAIIIGLIRNHIEKKDDTH